MKPLEKLLAEHVVPEDARNELERRLPEICRTAGLPILLRFTYRDVTTRPDYVASSICRALSQAAAVSRLSA